VIETTVFVAMEDSLLTIHSDRDRTTGSWLHETSCQCLVSDALVHGRAYCGTDEGLLRTDDGGSSWYVVHNIPRGRHVTALAVSPVERGRDGSGAVYIGTEPSSLFRSADGGVSWDELPALIELPSASTWSFPPHPETHHVRCILPDPIDSARLFVAIEAGALVYSDDGGRTWHDRVPGGPRDTHALVIHPRATHRLYSAAGDGYFESADAGDSWTSPDEGLQHGYLVDIAIDPADPETVIVSAARGPFVAYRPSSAESYVYRRSGGSEWELTMSGLPQAGGTTASRFAVHPAEPGIIYAANNRGVFRSDDAGRSWRAIDVPWPRPGLSDGVSALACLPD